MNLRCLNCDLRSFTEQFETLEFTIRDGLTIMVPRVPVLQCRGCREKRYAGNVVARAELLAARCLFDEGYREPAAFRFARKTLGHRAADLAALLDVTVESVSRWENGRSPIDVATWAAVGALVNDRLNGNDYTERRLSAAVEGATGNVSVAYDAAVPCAQHHIGRVVFHMYINEEEDRNEPCSQPATVDRSQPAAELGSMC